MCGSCGLSEAWTFVICYFVAWAVYLGGGIDYNVNTKGMKPSIEAIPNIGALSYDRYRGTDDVANKQFFVL